jgi:molybdate transport system ATP-binding protein
MRHCVIHVSNNFNKQALIENLLQKKAPHPLQYYNKYNCVLFSAYAIQKLLKEEALHEYSGIAATKNQPLRNMSSGEQKKVLLHHLLQQQPAVLILDNVFENLDAATTEYLKIKLEETAHKINLVQILHRKKEALPFIENKISLHNNGKIKNYEEGETIHITHPQRLPAPLYSYETNGNELVRFTDVSVSYNERTVLQHINWVICKNEFWQLKGPNGSGKTTLLTMITGDNVKGYGQNLFLFGRKKGSGETVWDIKSKIGYLTPAMIDLFNTRQTALQIILGGFTDSIGLYTLPTEMQEQNAREWLQLLKMTHKANSPFCDCTPGEQRMVLIARAMVKHPPLLILDEPLTGLDDDNAARVIDLINIIAADSSSAVIYVSHQTEPGLQPPKIFELTGNMQGSTGRVL